MSAGALPGFRDFYPTELAERAYIMRVWREVARRYAFVEYDGPPLEPLELYTKKSGEEIVGQLYAFVDKGGRDVALRPEMTPTFARMVAAKANALRKPVRWFSVPQLFRYERQQKGRLREHFQLNVDIVGEADVTADAELLAVALDTMRAFGLTPDDVRARVSDRRLLNALLAHAGVPPELLPAVYAAVDKIDREPPDVIADRLRKAGSDDQVVERIFAIAQRTSWDTLQAEYAAVPELQEHLERLGRYMGYLESLGVLEWVQLDLTVVRGLAYYTGFVFELFDRRGEFRAICGGGRYDTLLESLAGVNMPALGFGMGDVVLRELLRDRGLLPEQPASLDYWVATDDGALMPMAMGAASLLRRTGHSAEYALRPQTLARQLKTAAAAGASNVLILRLQSLATDRTVVVKGLADGSERTTSIDAWMAEITGDAEPMRST